MRKAGILEEVVIPMIKHLEIAEKYIMKLKKNPESSEIGGMFKTIKEIVEKKKVILDERKEWEGDVIDRFSIIERHIDNILEDSECDTNSELKAILSKLQEMIKPSEKHDEENRHEKGGPSKTDTTNQQDEIDDSFVPFIDEIIDTLDPQLKHCLFCFTIFPENLQNISRIAELPESISNSTGLMILDVRACHNLENLPPKIKTLENLTHLDVSMCYLLDHIPRWIATLSKLEVFKGFVIGSSGNKNRCRLSDISGLRKLRKLSINIGHDPEGAEELKSLKKLSKLQSLTITWGIEEKEDKPGNGEGQAEKTSSITEIEPRSLEQKEKPLINAPANTFPENLEKLDLRCFPKAKAPEWLSPTELKNLKRLYIRGGKLAELRCSKTDSAWEVKILRLRFLKNLKEMKRTNLKKLFPSMKFFEWEEKDKFGKLKGITANEQQMDKFYKAEDEYLSSS
ncbi:hypothetical protein LUZ60_002438 [Juncus effusus]|nr:hypothetical protein LUZ60_002438 [Juncus effusus]